MSATGIDYRTARPSPTDVRAAGNDFVVRYLSDCALSNNLSKPEAEALGAAGLQIVTVWKTTSKDIEGGHDAGIYAATGALVQLEECGAPDDAVVYYQVEEDRGAAWADGFFRGIGEFTDEKAGPLSVGVLAPAGVCHEMLSKRLAAFSALATEALWLPAPGGWVPELHHTSATALLTGLPVDVYQAYSTFYGQWSPRKPTMGQYTQYVLQDGETLLDVAERYKLHWTTVWYFNVTAGHQPVGIIADLVKRGPNCLRAGDALLIPTPA